MPWEKQFDRTEVLEKAMHAFWQHGYDGTSMKDLISCMGLNPGSIYSAFGDKKALFCESLNHYEDLNKAQLREYEATLSPRDAILAVFEKLIEDIRTGQSCHSCLLLNTAVNAAAEHEEVDAIVKTNIAAFETFFRRMITAGQKAGDIPAKLDVIKTARILMALIIGGRVLGRGHVTEKEAQVYLEHAAYLLS